MKLPIFVATGGIGRQLLESLDAHIDQLAQA
jgi:hypothetical protein